MLPPKNRLTKKKDFELVFKKGQSVKQDFLLAKALKTDAKASRFGFVVSKKVSTKATVRNKVRRRLQKAVQDILPKIKTTTDVIIVALPGIEKKEFTEIQQAVDQVFKKIGIM